MKDNIFLKILWAILTFFLAIIVICLILAFFFFLGCPYEFVKCYLNRNEKDDDDDDDNYNYDNKKEEEKLPLIWTDYLIIFCLIVLGIFMQPLYLMFYLLMAMMQVFRQFGCWVFWAYSI